MGLRETINPKAHANTETLRQLNMVEDEEDIVISIKGSPRSSQNEETILESRVVKKSHLKHNPDSVRMKHIKISQLETFRLELMYRFIYYRVRT